MSLFVLNCLNSNVMIPEGDFAFITLISKVNNPSLLIHFRPINLCNVLYKKMAKCMTNRLKKCYGKGY